MQIELPHPSIVSDGIQSRNVCDNNKRNTEVEANKP